MTRTFHERIEAHPALVAMGEVWGRAQRFLYREWKKGRDWTGDLAVSHYRAFGLSAKQWEHCWRDLQGKLKSAKELRKVDRNRLEAAIASKKRKIGKVEKKVAKLTKTIVEQERRRKATCKARRNGTRLLKRDTFDVAKFDDARGHRDMLEAALHQHRRKLDSLGHELRKVDTPKAPCFGSRRLLNAQHHLAENGYADHAAWKADWQAARSAQFLAEGDAGKPSGNEFVRVEAHLHGFDLEVRLPESLSHLAETCRKSGGQIVYSIHFRDLRFRHGMAELHRALRESLPVTWRFVRDGGSWRVFAMVGLSYARQECLAREAGGRYACGALGIDLNVGHVAATLVDRFGNPTRTWTFPLPMVGLPCEAREDAARKAAAAIVALATELGVPLVAEKLEFSQKRATLADTHGARYARMLSSFSYSSFGRALDSACTRASIHLRRVNPAFTSVIGDLCLAKRHGLSVHHAAAATIARRAMNLSERLPSFLVQRSRRGDHVTLPRPAWNGVRHVWSVWRTVARARRSVLTGPSGPGGSTRSLAHPADSGARRGGGSPPSGAGVKVPGNGTALRPRRPRPDGMGSPHDANVAGACG